MSPALGVHRLSQLILPVTKPTPDFTYVPTSPWRGVPGSCFHGESTVNGVAALGLLPTHDPFFPSRDPAKQPLRARISTVPREDMGWSNSELSPVTGKTKTRSPTFHTAHWEQGQPILCFQEVSKQAPFSGCFCDGVSL